MRTGCLRAFSLIFLLVSFLRLISFNVIVFEEEFIDSTQYTQKVSELKDTYYSSEILGYEEAEAEFLLDIYENEGIKIFQLDELTKMRIDHHTIQDEDDVSEKDLSILLWSIRILTFLTICLYVIEFILHCLGTKNAGVSIILLLFFWYYVIWYVVSYQSNVLSNGLEMATNVNLVFIFTLVSCFLWFGSNYFMEDNGRYTVLDLIKGRKKVWFMRIFSGGDTKGSDDDKPVIHCTVCGAENDRWRTYCNACGILLFKPKKDSDKDEKREIDKTIKAKDKPDKSGKTADKSSKTADKSVKIADEPDVAIKSTDKSDADAEKKSKVKIKTATKQEKEGEKEEKSLELFVIYDNQVFEKKMAEYMKVCPGCGVENAMAMKTCMLCGRKI